jgi:hypothetical protein
MQEFPGEPVVVPSASKSNPMAFLVPIHNIIKTQSNPLIAIPCVCFRSIPNPIPIPLRKAAVLVLSRS